MVFYTSLHRIFRVIFLYCMLNCGMAFSLSHSDELNLHFYLRELDKMGFPLSEISGNFPEITDMFSLQGNLAMLIGKSISKLPSEEEIVDQVHKLYTILYTYQSRGFILSTSPEALKQLRHNPNTLRQVAPFHDYSRLFKAYHQLWLQIQQNRKKALKTSRKLWLFFNEFIGGKTTVEGNWEDFYSQLYLKLKSQKLLRKLPVMVIKGKAGSTIDIIAKRSFLINLLAGLKDPANDRELNPEIKSVFKTSFPTAGLAPQELDEMRLKLLFINAKIENMNEDEKLLVLTLLLHAGKNCSDAKKYTIDQLFKRFCPDMNRILETMLYDGGGAINLERKAHVIAAREKAIKLERIIGEAIDHWITAEVEEIPDSRGLISSKELARERISAEFATWDYYAPQIGLPKKGASYGAYKLNLREAYDASGNYSVTHLVKTMQAELQHEVMEECAGFLRDLFPAPEALVLGKLQEWQFLTPKHKQPIQPPSLDTYL